MSIHSKSSQSTLQPELMVTAFLKHLAEQGIKLSIDGGNLNIKAPKGSLTPELKEKIARHKPEILKWLTAVQQTATETPIPVVSREQPLPLSLGQERLWQLLTLDPSSTIYNVPMAFKVSGPLDITILEQVISEVVRRHEILRTTISLVDGQPVQLIHPPQPWNISTHDLSELLESQVHLEIQNIVEKARGHRFNLELGPLLLTELIRLPDPDTFILLFVFHHIAIDGWSINLLFSEIQTIYRAVTDSQQPSLPKLPIQYADYSAWQRQWLNETVLEEKITYWQQQLKVPISGLKLPTSKPMSLTQRNQVGSSYPIQISKELTESLRDLSLTQDTTMFIVLFSGLYLLFHYCLDQDDLIICTPGACRNHSLTKNLIGYFNNILPVRIQISENEKLTDFLAQVKSQVLGAFNHQDLPFQQIAELPGISHVPLTKVLFTVLPKITQPLSQSDLSVTQFEVSRASSNFELSLTLAEQPGSIQGAFEYQSSLFDEGMISHLTKGYILILNAIAANPDLQISELRNRQEEILEWQQQIADMLSVTPSQGTYIPPRDDLEAKLVKIWEEIFDYKPIGVQDNFFELGGTSLLALKLAALIKKRLGRPLSLPLLSSAPTIEGLAACWRWGLGIDPRGSKLVPLKPSGDNIPLFMASGLGNHAYVFTQMVPYLSPEQPLYALRPFVDQANQKKVITYENMEDVAKACIEDIRLIQPAGPYQVGGYSGGSFVAYEIARQLKLQGEEVKLLLVMDVNPRTLTLVKQQNSRQSLSDLLDKLKSMFVEFSKTYKEMNDEEDDLSTVQWIRSFVTRSWLFGYNILFPVRKSIVRFSKCLRNYELQPYPGTVTFFRTAVIDGQEFTELDEDGGWSEWATEVNTYILPGNHFNLLTDESLVRFTMDQLNQCLSQKHSS
ncbi:MAG: hypothetical protein HC921_19095 [Synechococcaceae cyanobacterium SM2_3_1]|nr:hypothetical protein [Synechococcaceae cyanobacterium SM2_3_1]